MREAVGQTYLFYIVIFIVSVVALLLISSVSYSKAFRVKNRIVDIIEKYECYENCGLTGYGNSIEEINVTLASIGYKVDPVGSISCNDTNGGLAVDVVGRDYSFCVYKHETNRGYYYRVVAYMYFDIPIINNTVKIPVSGITKTIYTNHGEV